MLLKRQREWCAQWRGEAPAPRAAVHGAAAQLPLGESAGQQEGGSDAPGSTRWSQALAGLLPDFSGWRSPAAAPGGGTGESGGALALARDPAGAQELPKVRRR